MIECVPADPNQPSVADLNFNARIAWKIAEYWSLRGLKFNARIVPIEENLRWGSLYCIQSNMKNGLPTKQGVLS